MSAPDPNRGEDLAAGFRRTKARSTKIGFSSGKNAPGAVGGLFPAPQNCSRRTNRALWVHLTSAPGGAAALHEGQEG